MDETHTPADKKNSNGAGKENPRSVDSRRYRKFRISRSRLRAQGISKSVIGRRCLGVGVSWLRLDSYKLKLDSFMNRTQFLNLSPLL